MLSVRPRRSPSGWRTPCGRARRGTHRRVRGAEEDERVRVPPEGRRERPVGVAEPRAPRHGSSARPEATIRAVLRRAGAGAVRPRGTTPRCTSAARASSWYVAPRVRRRAHARVGEVPLHAGRAPRGRRAALQEQAAPAARQAHPTSTGAPSRAPSTPPRGDLRARAPPVKRETTGTRAGGRRRSRSVTPWVSRRTSTLPCSRSGTTIDSTGGAGREWASISRMLPHEKRAALERIAREGSSLSSSTPGRRAA